MTTIFVSAVDGNNADNGTTWALAKQTVNGALAIAVSGDVIVVDNAGTFTATAAITWTAATGNIAIISVTRSGTVSFVWGAGATESVGASSNNFNITGAVGTVLYVYGMSLNGGTNNNAACNITFTTARFMTFDTCTFDLPTVSDRTLLFNNANTILLYVKFLSCTFKHTAAGAIGQYFDINSTATVEIVNPTFTFSSTMPSQLLGMGTSGKYATYIMRDGNISGFSGAAVVSIDRFGQGHILLENLRLHATPTISAGTWPTTAIADITVRNCDSADTTYTFQYINPFGILTADETIYITSGGAVFDGAGVSWKIVTTAACGEATPFITPGVFIWDTTLTAQTASIEIIRDNATALTDRDIWSDLDSAASASFSNYTYQTNQNSNPFTGTAVDQPTSTATWTGTGGFTNQTKQKLQNTFTAAAAGLLQARISVGVASTTFYIDPFLGGVS